MNRIVLDPAELYKMATQMVEAGDDYTNRARTLRARPVPDMPPSIAAGVVDGLAEVGARLERTAARLEAEAFLLRMRAAIVSGDMGNLAVYGLTYLAGTVGDHGGDALG
ncbi:MAG: hypothetical protein M3238_07965 [Actinomycetota bacterium]|nr:hypothetical protein [Actinomycetota bacterium]